MSVLTYSRVKKSENTQSIYFVFVSNVMDIYFITNASQVKSLSEMLEVLKEMFMNSRIFFWFFWYASIFH